MTGPPIFQVVILSPAKGGMKNLSLTNPAILRGSRRIYNLLGRFQNQILR